MRKLFNFAQSVYHSLLPIPVIGPAAKYIVIYSKSMRKTKGKIKEIKKDPWEILSLHANAISSLQDAQQLFNSETQKELALLHKTIDELQKEVENLQRNNSKEMTNEL